jgi:hypothetical protein
MISTYEIYSELFQEKKLNENKTKISQLIVMENGKELIYSVDLVVNSRQLYVATGNNYEIVLPDCQGIMVTKVQLPEYDPHKNYYEISQTDIGEGDIFEVIIEDIRKNLSIVRTKDTEEKIAFDILRKWRNFFAMGKEIVMSKERQQGLFGELKCLDGFIDIFGPIAVSYWMGCKYETHDFYINNHAIEVKTTSTKEPYRMHISSEYQLDETEILGNLFIRFYALRISDVEGELLNDLIAIIRHKLSDNAIMSTKFKDALEEYGYFEGVSNKYVGRYTIREKRNFKVYNKFPRIRKNEFSSGIANCTYDVIVSACSNYEVEENEVIKILQGDKNER